MKNDISRNSKPTAVFDAENKMMGFYGGDKYDFTKYTNEEYEVYCWYNTIFYWLFSPISSPS